MKTQVLITDVPKNKFDSKWPDTLEKKLFKEKYPQYRKHLQYFTPLPFLDRVIIILDDEAATMEIYEYLQKEEPSLLSNRFRSRSMGESSPEDSNAASNGSADGNSAIGDKPILSLDTNPVSTGINVQSLAMGSPSLSPDRRTSLESPTLLKFANDEKAHLYREPLPTKSDSSKESSPGTTELHKSQKLTVSTDAVNKMASNTPPPLSPSITVDEFFN
ncbi:related to Regulator of calcineurin 2 [Nakaseomyces glabratus]|nr:related to Regulator of calcineurin 2 [Nakaseomyces glabratus]SLM12191.1 related to Regulator of calcineurin 2 [Nakaseomyces glabratus]